jgi:hypothetical protein
MVAPIETTSRFRPSQERPLFGGAFNWRTEPGMNYALDHITGRFLMILPPSAGGADGQPSVRVIANWDPTPAGARTR